MITNNEEYKARKIPDNYENGINFGGFNFKPIFLIEGIILGIICFGITISLFYLGTNKISSSIIGICLVPCILAMLLGIKGINDEPLTTFIKNLKYFNSHKRITYFNPRIKKETSSISNSEDLNKSVLPRDKIIALFTKYKKAIKDKNIQQLQEEKDNHKFEKERMFFEDDIGIVEKPIDYMTRQEYKQYKKQIKRDKKLKTEKANEN